MFGIRSINDNAQFVCVGSGFETLDLKDAVLDFVGKNNGQANKRMIEYRNNRQQFFSNLKITHSIVKYSDQNDMIEKIIDIFSLFRNDKTKFAVFVNSNMDGKRLFCDIKRHDKIQHFGWKNQVVCAGSRVDMKDFDYFNNNQNGYGYGNNNYNNGYNGDYRRDRSNRRNFGGNYNYHQNGGNNGYHYQRKTSQKARENTLNRIKNGNFRILIATDMYNHAINLDCSIVIHVDFPRGPGPREKDYCERISRLHNKEEKGLSINLINRHSTDEEHIRSVLNKYTLITSLYEWEAIIQERRNNLEKRFDEFSPQERGNVESVFMSESSSDYGSRLTSENGGDNNGRNGRNDSNNSRNNDNSSRNRNDRDKEKRKSSQSDYSMTGSEYNKNRNERSFKKENVSRPRSQRVVHQMIDLTND